MNFFKKREDILAKISVITPVYEVENYLRKCIDSILNQTFRDFELIIVDDGSPDLCGSIADEYVLKDPRVKVIHKFNEGAPSARNRGIDIATGEFLYFPDSDDWIEPDYLEQLYKTAIETDAQMVISGYTMEYFENGVSNSYSVSTPKHNYYNKDLVRKNLHNYFDNMMMAVPWNKLYKTEYILNNNLRFPQLKWDDLHFNMEVIMDIEKVAICTSSGYHFFRSRSGSETTTVFDNMLYKKRKEQFRHILKVYNHWHIVDREILAVIYGYYLSRLVQCVQEIAISNNTRSDKRKMISDILNDRCNRMAIKVGKVQSKLLSIAALPMRMRDVTLCIIMGRIIGYVKINMSSLFYEIKSKSVNKAKVIN